MLVKNLFKKFINWINSPAFKTSSTGPDSQSTTCCCKCKKREWVGGPR